MFERFTDRARRVVVQAQEQSRLLGRSYIGTEHLLLGMLTEGDGIAGKALTDVGMTLDTVREAVEQLVGRGDAANAGQHIPFTPNAKKCLENALFQALELGHSYIGTEHLLLSLLNTNQATANGVLASLGYELDEVGQQVLDRLGLAEVMMSTRNASVAQLRLQLNVARAKVTSLEQVLQDRLAEQS